jgi:hypoxanthine phosphoribosyltransferase
MRKGSIRQLIFSRILGQLARQNFSMSWMVKRKNRILIVDDAADTGELLREKVLP